MNSLHPIRSPWPVMSLGVADTKRLIPANRCAYSREAESSKRTEVIRALSEQKNTFGALADHLISEEHSTKKELPLHTEMRVNVSQATLRNAIAAITDMIKDLVTALITSEDYNRISRMENRLEVTLKALVNRVIDEKF